MIQRQSNLYRDRSVAGLVSTRTDAIIKMRVVKDQIGQQVIKDYLEDRFEAIFSESSYGYRPLRSTHQAVAQVRRNVRELECYRHEHI
jgi:retron-type reverse transcriptase